MANFDAQINLNVNNANAVKGLDKVETALNKLNKEAAKFEELFSPLKLNKALNGSLGQADRLTRALQGQKQAAAAFNQELERTARILQNIQVKQRALPAARAAVGVLPPGRTAGLLPAAGGTSANTDRARFDRAAAAAREVDERNYRAATQASIQAANELTVAIEQEVTARKRAARQVTEITEKTANTAQKLLPFGNERGNQLSGPAAGVGERGTPGRTYQAKLQREVDRQLKETGRLTKEIRETVASYNKVQTENNKLVKTTGRLVTATKSATSSRNKTKGGFGLGAAIGFPLLFGGGPGSLLGSVLGQLKGGPDGAILGSGLGSAFDRATEGLTRLTQELDNTGDIFAALENGGYKVSGSLKSVVDELEDAGKLSEAYAIQLRELEKVYGKRATTDLGNLGRANQRLADSFKRLNAVLFAPLIPLATAISNITSGAITQLTRLFEFIAGDPANRAATPSFRLEGEFAQATGVEREIFNRSGRSREAVKARQEDQRKLIDSFNQASQAQARVNEQQRKGAEELNKLELTRKGLAVERARIEADSLRYQLQVQGQIRNLELARRISQEKAADKTRQILANAARQQLEIFKQTGAPDEKIIETFGTIFRNESKVALDDYLGQLNEVYARLDEADRLEFFPKGRQSIIEMTNKMADLLEQMGLIEQIEFETVPDQIRKNAQDQIALLEAQIKVEEAVTDELRDQAKLELLILKIKQANPELEATDPDAFKRLVDLTAKLNNLTDKAKKDVDDLAKEINTTLASAMENALVDTITAAIQGADDLGEKLQALASDLLGSLGRIFINAGISGLAGPGGLFGADGLPGFGKRADGGPVAANRPYMVGERGPELFVPNNSGTVVSNEALGRYSGGGGGGATTISFQSQIINNVEYVTVEQAMAMSKAAADDGARRGAAGGHNKSMSTLRNSRSQRAKLGMS